MQNRLEELRNRLELLKREIGEVEYLIKGYEDTIKLQEEGKDKKSEPKKKVESIA
tara:strand:- start:512 stop:676 length:165 start_codon:yes stop_codon:yes gene_type:complete